MNFNDQNLNKKIYKQQQERGREREQSRNINTHSFLLNNNFSNSSGTNTVNLQSHAHITLGYKISNGLLYGLHTVKTTLNQTSISGVGLYVQMRIDDFY